MIGDFEIKWSKLSTLTQQRISFLSYSQSDLNLPKYRCYFKITE